MVIVLVFRITSGVTTGPVGFKTVSVFKCTMFFIKIKSISFLKCGCSFAKIKPVSN
jgi:hypothetical protein